MPHPLETTLGYTFANPALLTHALSHRSAAAQHNERLEFLGDRVLNLAIAQALMAADEQAPEGLLTTRHAAFVRTETLKFMAEKWQLANHVQVGPGETPRGAMLADAVEALLGAVFLDGGFASAAAVVHTWWGPLLAGQDAENWQDPKTRVQEMLQAAKQALPVYQVVQETGPDHAKHFMVEIQTVRGNARGEAASKHKAGQAAAAALLKQWEGQTV